MAFVRKRLTGASPVAGEVAKLVHRERAKSEQRCAAQD
jgi:hypothetical protein